MNSVVVACPPRSNVLTPPRRRLERRPRRSRARRARRPVRPSPPPGPARAAQARIIAIGLARSLPCSDGAVPCGASAIATSTAKSSSKAQQDRLGARDRAEHRHHQVRQAVAVAVQRRDHERHVGGAGQQPGVGRVDQHRPVLDVGMALGGGVHLLLEHPLVDGRDRPLRAAVDARAGALGGAERELGHGAADVARDPLGAQRDLVDRRPPRPRATARRRRRRRPPCARRRSGSARRRPGRRRRGSGGPVRMMTLPSTSSRRIRLGEPTSSLPSGVTVAALMPEAGRAHRRARPRRRSRCASRAGARARGRGARARSRGRRRSGSSTRSACSSSSWPVSSPSRTTILSGSAMQSRGSEPCSSSSSARSSSAAITKARCSSKSTPSSSAPLAQLVAVDRGGERRRLHLLLDRLGRQAVDPGRAHVRARHDEAGQLVDGEQRLLHRRCRARRRGSPRARRPRGPARAGSRAPRAPSARSAGGRSRGRDGARSRGRAAAR